MAGESHETTTTTTQKIGSHFGSRFIFYIYYIYLSYIYIGRYGVIFFKKNVGFIQHILPIMKNDQWIGHFGICYIMLYSHPPTYNWG